jgi:hypothetical protein
VLAKSFALAFLDDIHAVTQIALLEDDVAGLEMLLPNPGFKSDLGLRQLGRKTMCEGANRLQSGTYD